MDNRIIWNVLGRILTRIITQLKIIFTDKKIDRFPTPF